MNSTISKSGEASSTPTAMTPRSSANCPEGSEPDRVSEAQDQKKGEQENENDDPVGDPETNQSPSDDADGEGAAEDSNSGAQRTGNDGASSDGSRPVKPRLRSADADLPKSARG